MSKLTTGSHVAIRHRLLLFYFSIVDQGVPDRFAAVLSALDGDLAALATCSQAA